MSELYKSVITRIRPGLSALLCSSAVLALAANPASAAGGSQYFGLGGGGGMITHGDPCPDLPCNGTDKCSCVTGSGDVSFTRLSGGEPKTGTFTLEMSADVSTGMANGEGGQCFNSAGYMIITTARGTLTLPFAGPACRLGPGGGGMDAAPFGVSSTLSVSAGTGGYKNPTGAGTLAATLDAPSKKLLLNIVGYGILK